jgi:beta-fructofuranosidase
MSLRLDDRWAWDFWPVRDGPDHHLFFLQADRALGDPDLRHWKVSIGHAVSPDLVHWELLPDALAPGPPGSWDDYTTWTGSVIGHDGRWHLLYTGTNRSERGLVQRVGLATSEDLVHWHRHPANPVLTAAATWYEMLDPEAWFEQAWRDPWVLRHPHTGDFHALITARARGGRTDERGVIGHARSDDIVSWEVLPPLTEPGEFGQLEVPQLVPLEGRWYLLFSSAAEHHSVARRSRLGGAVATATYALVAEAPLGPFRALSDEPLLTGPDTLYAGKVVTGPSGDPVYLAFRAEDARGRFVGEVTDPIPVTVADDGRLIVG